MRKLFSDNADRYRPIQYPKQEIDFFTQDTIYSEIGNHLVYDIECYPNYFLIAFKSVISGRVVYFEFDNYNKPLLRWMIENFKFVGFNTKSYDLPMLSASIDLGYTTERLHEFSHFLIYECQNKYDLYINPIAVDIDLKEVAKGKASLKMYAARLHSRRLQSLPYDPNQNLTMDQMAEVREYCIADLDDTLDLYNFLKPQLDLREEMGRHYKVNLMSKSDAQIAETVITREIYRIKKSKIRKRRVPEDFTFRYQPPQTIQFTRPELNQVYDIVKNTDFYLTPKGKVRGLNKINFSIGNSTYSLINGGLHSNEKSTTHISDDEFVLIDADVASYYPSIIINQRLYPHHLGDVFLEVFEPIRDDRIVAKRAGKIVKADSLKIVVNGSFGKFGSKYSKLFAPELLIQVTLSGQLYLIMLIDWLTNFGFEVVSANTDGIVTKVKRDRISDYKEVTKYWETITGFELEFKEYSRLCSRDVNNYLAFYGQGKYKAKGIFADFQIDKNPINEVCKLAIVDHVTKGTQIRDFIYSCDDIKKFISVRQVKGGAEKDGVPLGNVVRWYYKKFNRSNIRYIMSGNQVPDTVGAWPLMMLPDAVPDDLDRDWYVKKAESLLKGIGFYGNAYRQIKLI